MGKNPSFPFYPSDWTRDLDDQDIEIEGAWIRIICRLWWAEEKGKLTKSLKEWSRILRKTEQKTLKIFQILIKKRLADGEILDNQNITIINRRMKRYDEICKLRQEVGKKGGNPVLLKLKKNLDNQTDNQNRLPSSSFSSSYNNIPPISPKGGNGDGVSKYQYPDWLNKELWSNFKRMRSKIKKPITSKRTIDGLLSGLKAIIDQGYKQDVIIQEAIDRCWQKFYIPKNLEPELNQIQPSVKELIS